MLQRRRHVLAVLSVALLAGCEFRPAPPPLPERFEGPLSEIADSLIASTSAGGCSVVRHLDFGTTPQGCNRLGDVPGWVNWTGAAKVVKVGREWLQPDVATALEVGRQMEQELSRTLGAPVECHYRYQWTTREVRWIANERNGVSTALIVWGNVPTHTATPRVVLMRALGPEGCGHHNDRPFVAVHHPATKPSP